MGEILSQHNPPGSIAFHGAVPQLKVWSETWIWQPVRRSTWTILLLMPRVPTPDLSIAIKFTIKNHTHNPIAQCTQTSRAKRWTSVFIKRPFIVDIFGFLALYSGAGLQIYADANVFISMHNYLTAGSCDIRKLACIILWGVTSAFIERFHINILELVFAYVGSSAPVCIPRHPKNGVLDLLHFYSLVIER